MYVLIYSRLTQNLRLYRAKIIKELDKKLADEIDWLNRVSEENLKNYQIWYVSVSLPAQVIKYDVFCTILRSVPSLICLYFPFSYRLLGITAKSSCRDFATLSLRKVTFSLRNATFSWTFLRGILRTTMSGSIATGWYDILTCGKTSAKPLMSKHSSIVMSTTTLLGITVTC